jgi:hypothetical protein
VRKFVGVAKITVITVDGSKIETNYGLTQAFGSPLPCDVNPIGGCQCNEDPNVPSVHVGDCLIKRCINASP